MENLALGALCGARFARPDYERRLCHLSCCRGAALMSSSAPGAAPAPENDEFTGYGGVGDYADSNGNTREVMLAGHQMRDGVFDRTEADAADTGEMYDCVVVGGGIRTRPPTANRSKPKQMVSGDPTGCTWRQEKFSTSMPSRPM